MNNEILTAYRESIEANAKKEGTKPRALTENDERIAAIAATYSEADLRHAVVMRATYERKKLVAAKSAPAPVDEQPSIA